MTVVRLKDVCKSFNGVQVLRNLSFEANDGEVLCLIGPSGSGKSTTLRAINALETIDSGSIEICGQSYDTPGLSPHLLRRNTAMIFQRFELFPHMSVHENVTLGPLHVLKVDRLTADKTATALLEQVGLAAHAQKYPHQLSGGQQQRVAIARALALKPKVLLCDEPTSALDPELVHEVTEVLGQIAKNSAGMTMIIVTHEIAFARKIGGRVIFLDHGSIVEEGPAAEILFHAKSERLQQFLKNIGQT